MSIDTAVGECFDKASSYVKKYYKAVLDGKEARQAFIEAYNSKAKAANSLELIPMDYYNFLDGKKFSGGRFIELLARYGDPSVTVLPTGIKSDITADMSYTGLRTAIQCSVRFPSNSHDFSSMRYLKTA
jgi:tRNA A37 threonylcarbamoyltransferase TsaD